MLFNRYCGRDNLFDSPFSKIYLVNLSEPMNIFIKANWFKVMIAGAVLAVAVSIGYYFLFSKPNLEKLQLEIKQGQVETRKECFNEATKYKNSIIKTESEYIGNVGKITRADYDKIFNDTYQECLLEHGLDN